MHHFSLVLFVAIIGYAGNPPHGEGWRSLFNGKDFSGWTLPGKEHNWQVIDGVMDYEAKGGSIATEAKYRNYELYIEWRFKRTEGNERVWDVVDGKGEPVLGPDGQQRKESFKNADSGIFLRGTGQTQVNLWCWPCGSGQLWSFRKHKDPAVRDGAWPDSNADKPVGQWNTFHITLIGESPTVVNNGVTVTQNAPMPGIPSEGPIILQHNGGKNAKTGVWNNASSLIQFRNLWIRPLPDK